MFYRKLNLEKRKQKLEKFNTNKNELDDDKS